MSKLTEKEALALIAEEDANRLPTKEELEQDAEWAKIVAQAEADGEVVHKERAATADALAKATGIDRAAIKRLLGV